MVCCVKASLDVMWDFCMTTDWWLQHTSRCVQSDHMCHRCFSAPMCLEVLDSLKTTATQYYREFTETLRISFPLITLHYNFTNITKYYFFIGMNMLYNNVDNPLYNIKQKRKLQELTLKHAVNICQDLLTGFQWYGFLLLYMLIYTFLNEPSHIFLNNNNENTTKE